MAKKGFVVGMLALALVFGLGLTGCEVTDGDGGTSFDGSTLSGTTWSVSGSDDGTNYTVTYKFTSGTAGTRTLTGDDIYAALFNSDFTYTYDATAHTDTVTTTLSMSGTTIKEAFMVDVSAKTLTIAPDDEEDEPTVLNLK